MKEAVGLFHNADQLQLAIKELERTDFPRDAMSILGADEDAIKKQFGYMDVEQLEEADIKKEAPIRSEERGIGASVAVTGSIYIGAMAVALAAGAVTIPGILAAAVIGGAGGGAVGGVLAKILGDKYDATIEDQIKKGGILLWVRASNADQENKACDILREYGADHIKIRDI